jgi:hypothetical protein
MQINGLLSGDVEIKRVRMHDNDLREAIVVLDTKVKKENAAKIWGDEFVNVAFAGLMKTESGEPSWAFEKMAKPNLTCEMHQVAINGLSVTVQPEILSIEAIEGEEAVRVPVQMRIDLANEKMAGKVAFAVGVCHEMRFDAKQVAIPGSNANAPGVRIVKGAHGNPKPVHA